MHDIKIHMAWQLAIAIARSLATAEHVNQLLQGVWYSLASQTPPPTKIKNTKGSGDHLYIELFSWNVIRVLPIMIINPPVGFVVDIDQLALLALANQLAN